MAVPNSNVNQLTAITNDFFIQGVKDLVHDQNVFFQMLKKNARYASGGAKINQPILYQFTQDGAYFDFEKGSTAAEDQITRAEFNWKLYRQRIVISEPEMDMNSGPEEVYDLLDAKTKGAGMAIRDALGTDLWTSTNGDSTRGVNSIQNILGNGTVPATNTVCGGIDKASYAFWRGNTNDVTGEVGLVGNMLESWFLAVDGTITPNLIVSHPDEIYQHQLEATTSSAVNRSENFTNTNQMTSGFTVFTFQGQPWVSDLHCPADAIFMLNMDFFHLVTHKKRDFQLKPFVQPVDQDVNIAWVKWMGNITCSDPSRSVWEYE